MSLVAIGLLCQAWEFDHDAITSNCSIWPEARVGSEKRHRSAEVTRGLGESTLRYTQRALYSRQYLMATGPRLVRRP